MVAVTDTTAVGILDALLGRLSTRNGFTEDFLSQFWLGIGTNGASVMLGKPSLWKETYPNLLTWHCFNHRLELAVHDAVKACTEVNHFKIFTEKLYSLYSIKPNSITIHIVEPKMNQSRCSVLITVLNRKHRSLKPRYYRSVLFDNRRLVCDTVLNIRQQQIVDQTDV